MALNPSGVGLSSVIIICWPHLIETNTTQDKTPAERTEDCPNVFKAPHVLVYSIKILISKTQFSAGRDFTP